MHIKQQQQQSDQNRHDIRRIAVIPAYNESRFIGSVVIQAKQHVDTVVVVDDGSTDTTSLVAQLAGATVLTLPQNSGKGKAVEAGLNFAAQWQPQQMVLLDGDGQHNPHQIPALLAPLLAGDADLVVGSRFTSVIKSDIPRWRQVGQHTLTWLTNIGSGVQCSDSQSGFRAFSAEILPHLTFSSHGFSLESEMQFIVQQHQLRLLEVPISVDYSEGPKRNPVTHGLEVVNGIIRLIGVSRPLLFWAVLSTITLLAGLLTALQTVSIYQQTAILAIGYALICGLLLTSGISMISTGIILHSLRTWLIEKGHTA